MTSNYHTPITVGAEAKAATINDPLSELDTAIGLAGGGANVTRNVLFAWVESGAYELKEITRDSDGVITSATVKWPDGTSGVFTTTAKNATWLAIDAYQVTHPESGKTVMQAAVTRDADGNVIIKPVLTIA